jgi:large subunit ribosomal protein L28
LARKCTICGKGVEVGMKVSHSHIRTKRTWAANLQRVKAVVDGSPKRILVCTRCLRSGKVKRAI